MNKPLKVAADYVFGKAAPAAGETFPVADGVVWIRMAMPLELNHINLWMIREGNGWAAVDTGFPHESTAQSWETILESHKLTRLICTHHHPDHMGLAQWLTDRAGVRLWASHGEWAYGRQLMVDDGEVGRAAFDDFYAPMDLGKKSAILDHWRHNPYRQIVRSIPPQFRRLVDGQTLTIGDHDWTVMVGRGHAPEHCCLYCPELNVLIAGDQVLPRITPNVSVWFHDPECDPLRLFLDSLDQFLELPEDTLVLPSHGYPFRGLHGRVDEIRRHHDEQLDVVRQTCAGSATVNDVLTALYGAELVSYPFFFAIGETVAHLNYLLGRGELILARDGQGIDRYQMR